MGTSTFAVPSLQRLLDTAHTLLAVVTQPDRPQGRGRRPTFPPVKNVALTHQVRVLQPQRANDLALMSELRSLAPQVIVVASYGLMLPSALLAIPPWGCLNVHASLLPHYRGAAPINWALIHGEHTTGVTIMQIEATLDTGPILLQSEITIDLEDNAASLQARLADLGADVLLEALRALEAGTVQAIPQDHGQASYAPKLRKDDGVIRWDRSAVELANRIRGVTPWPGAVTTHAGKSLRICRAVPVSETGAQRPGTVVRIEHDGVWVETADGYLVLTEVQPASGRRMPAAAYARGHGLHTGAVLGSC